jgi:hypothetical protein
MEELLEAIRGAMEELLEAIRGAMEELLEANRVAKLLEDANCAAKLDDDAMAVGGPKRMMNSVAVAAAGADDVTFNVAPLTGAFCATTVSAPAPFL